jgi:hypothetical protein
VAGPRWFLFGALKEACPLLARQVLWALNPSESLLEEVRRDCSPKLFTTKGIFPITLVSSDSAFTGTEPDCGCRMTRSYSHCRHRCAVFRTRSVCRLWRPRSMLHNSPFSRSGRRTAPESLRRDLPGDAVGAGSGRGLHDQAGGTEFVSWMVSRDCA